MISAGVIIVACIAANTAINLYYPTGRTWGRISGWWKRSGRNSVFINRETAYELFKNIARDISPIVKGKDSVILSFIENSELFISRVPYPGESVFRRAGNNLFLEIISLGENGHVHSFEILFDPRKSSEFRNFLASIHAKKI